MKMMSARTMMIVAASVLHCSHVRSSALQQLPPTMLVRSSRMRQWSRIVNANKHQCMLSLNDERKLRHGIMHGDRSLVSLNNQNSLHNNNGVGDNGEDRVLSIKSQPDYSSSYLIFKASMLIAGTTVGGGFLALPQTVVVPLGSLNASLLSLLGVWSFFLSQSFILVDCILQCQKSINKEKQVDSSSSIGIPILATYALGEKGAAIAATLLIVLTEATIVSQISRAGSLFAGGSTAATLSRYRIGCLVATLLGAGLSFGGGFGGDCTQIESERARDQQDGNNPKRKEEERDPQIIDSSSEKTADTRRSFATSVNAILTAIFLLSAVLLFQTGSRTADWSRCFATSSSSVMPSKSFIQSIWGAIPTMLQLLAYGEILPNVCSMLQYHGPSIRKAIVFGSTIPLILLSGWAALGLALLPSTSNAAGIDPIDILIATGGSAIRSRLLILAASAIGTTILGSFLALESAYDDLSTKTTKGIDDRDSRLENTAENEDMGNQQWWQQQKFKAQVLKAMSIVLPPMAISAISPNVFLGAIDFAGSYPVILLWGIFPPLMAWMIRFRQRSSRNTKSGIGMDLNHLNRQENEFKIQPWLYTLFGLLSVAMISINGFQDIASICRFLVVWATNMLGNN